MKKILIVEGNQDKGFIELLFKRRKIDAKVNYGDFEIKPVGGFDKMITRLPVRFQTDNYDIIGLVVDADTDLQDHWNKLKLTFQKLGYQNLPKKPEPKGTIVLQNSLPKLGVWIMPDNQVEGTLETFVKFLIPDFDKDELLKLAEKTVDELIQKKLNLFSVSDRMKAIVHTWLAWQEEPGLSLGQAINFRFTQKEKGYLLDDRKASPFILWLQKLFKD
ncbi:MAG: DUF3226 domain-containing protein [Microscillaceae bacterium]|nr:DUF3226 domain-containing protein [Microscillaceae bacterium]